MNVENVIDKSFVRCDFKIVQNDDLPENEIEGYANVYDVIDLDGDLIEMGAFKKSLRERVSAGKVLFMDSHNWSVEGTIGIVTSAKEEKDGFITPDGEKKPGLFFRAKFSSVQKAQDARTKALEGIITAVSIGFKTLRHEYIDHDGQKVRHIKEAKLYEISLVPFGANPLAQVTGVKNDSGKTKMNNVMAAVKSGREISGDDFALLKQHHQEISNALVEAKVKGDDGTAQQPPETPEAPAEGKSAEPSVKARTLRARLKLLNLKH